MIRNLLIAFCFFFQVADSTAVATQCVEDLRALAEKNEKDYNRLVRVAGSMMNVQVDSRAYKWRALAGDNKLYVENVPMLERLKDAGGNGKLIETYFMDTGASTGFVALEITQPPKKPIYGTRFGEVQAEAKINGRDIWFFNGKYTPDGSVHEDVGGFAGSKGIFLHEIRTSNSVLIHELTHVRQSTSRHDEFYSSLLPISKPVMEFITRAENGEVLENWEMTFVKAQMLNFVARLELDAAWMGFISPFTPEGRHTFKSGERLKYRLLAYLNNAVHLPLYQFVHTGTGLLLNDPKFKVSFAKTIILLGAFGIAGYEFFQFPHWFVRLLLLPLKTSSSLTWRAWKTTGGEKGSNMFRLGKLASFIRLNMPLGATVENPMLTNEEAFDVAAFLVDDSVNPRPATRWNDYPNIEEKTIDFPVGPYIDSKSEQQHKYGPFVPIIEEIQKMGKTAYF